MTAPRVRRAEGGGRGRARRLGPIVQTRRSARLGAEARLWESHLGRALAGAGQRVGLGRGHELSLFVCDSRTIRRLNRRWRGEDRLTNVLAFPQNVTAEGRRPPAGPVGDIVVALPVARREARRRGMELRDHLIHLAIHGLLHLMGYDHHEAPAARRMQALERRLLDAREARG